MDSGMTPTEIALSVGAGVTGLGMALSKFRALWATDAKTASTAAADTGIIERLEKECKRLSDQNDKLASSLNEFQLQLITFRTENSKLSLENNSLKEENLSLREEIVELRKEVHELGVELMKIQRRHDANCAGCVHA